LRRSIVYIRERRSVSSYFVTALLNEHFEHDVTTLFGVFFAVFLH